MSRRRGQAAVYIVTAPPDFKPGNPFAIPHTFLEAAIHTGHLLTYQARGFVFTHNLAAMKQRQEAVSQWDGRWAVACRYLKPSSRRRREGVQS
jgi:hypothetical protein